MAQESHNPPAVAELIRGCETNTCFVIVNEGGLDRLTAEQMEQVPLSSPEAALQSA